MPYMINFILVTVMDLNGLFSFGFRIPVKFVIKFDSFIILNCNFVRFSGAS